MTAEPGWFDLELSVQKIIHWINEALKAGCKFVAFSEVVRLPGCSIHVLAPPVPPPLSSVRTNKVEEESLATRIGRGRYTNSLSRSLSRIVKTA